MSSECKDAIQLIGKGFFKELTSFFPTDRYKVHLNIRRIKPNERENAQVSLDTATITIATDRVDYLLAHLIHEYFHVYIADQFDFPYLITVENYDKDNLPYRLKKYTDVFNVIVFELRELVEILTIDYYAYKSLHYYAYKWQTAPSLQPFVDLFFKIKFASYKEFLERLIDRGAKFYWYKFRRNEPLFKEEDLIPIKFIYNENIKIWFSLFDLFSAFVSGMICKKTESMLKYFEVDIIRFLSEREIIKVILDNLTGLDGEEKDVLSKGLSFLADLVEKLRQKIDDCQKADPRLVFKEFVEGSLN